MTFNEYLDYFKGILEEPSAFPLYTNEEYLAYTKLNWSRMNRWLKKFGASDEIQQAVNAVKQPQQWIIITEPWCGDAAHSVPQLVEIARSNPHIQVDIQLRDTSPFLIDNYLTNGGKSIPKLIVRDSSGADIFVWGPRPQGAQALFDKLKDEARPFEDIKEALQKWYNVDKGQELQLEILRGVFKI